MKSNVIKYIENNYQYLLEITRNITKKHDLSEDLLHEVVMNLLEKKEIKLQKVDDDQIKYYIIHIIQLNWISKTSPFFRKIRREFTLYNELTEYKEILGEDDTLSTHFLIDLVEENWAELDFLHKSIMERYMITKSLKKVSIQTGIPTSSVSRYVKEARNIIITNIKLKLENGNNRSN